MRPPSLSSSSTAPVAAPSPSPTRPFSIGRLPENDLVLAHPYVSRRHAELIVEAGTCYIVDQGSRHGTFINGKPSTTRQAIGANDTVHFGALDGPSLRISAEEPHDTSTIRDIIDQIPEVSATGNALEKLRWFFESARKLKTSDAVDQILTALLDTTLQLTQVERGYVFLRNEAGEMQLALGRDDKGEEPHRRGHAFPRRHAPGHQHRQRIHRDRHPQRRPGNPLRQHGRAQHPLRHLHPAAQTPPRCSHGATPNCSDSSISTAA